MESCSETKSKRCVLLIPMISACSVKDSGIGISEEQMNQLFNEYYKADTSHNDFDSSGLGSTICQRIVERNDGKIWVESDGLGQGSTFYFSLPKTTEK